MIEFTQYMRPNGRQEIVRITRPEEIERKALHIQSLGCRLEVEEMMTGMVSLTVENPKNADDPTVAIELVMNGPGVPAAVDKLIEKAYYAMTTPAPKEKSE